MRENWQCPSDCVHVPSESNLKRIIFSEAQKREGRTNVAAAALYGCMCREAKPSRPYLLNTGYGYQIEVFHRLTFVLQLSPNLM